MDLNGIDESVVEKVAGEGYFAREKGKKGKEGEEEFFAQGEKPEVSMSFLVVRYGYIKMLTYGRRRRNHPATEPMTRNQLTKR